jgi:glycosyltransferase involved in cell wall biosynthesis
MIWDHMSHRFDDLVARRYVPKTQAVHCFEYTALTTFERARSEGVATILHLPSLNSQQYEDINRREQCRWKDLVGKNTIYFERKFSCRQERRLREIALADVIIANSALTARSHIAAGADAAKTFVVPLGAPLPISELRISAESLHGPLNVIWAGAFSLRKGAHYLLKAWQLLNAKSAANLNVYGKSSLSDSLLSPLPDGIMFRGSVPRSTLFKAYEQADVLVFPTLSDGFGMVIGEAMAHGLPVITTDQAGAAELVTANNGLVVPAADPQALAAALRWCLDNRDKLQAMRFKALETAQARQWSHFRQDLIGALEAGLRRAGYKPLFARPE